MLLQRNLIKRVYNCTVQIRSELRDVPCDEVGLITAPHSSVLSIVLCRVVMCGGDWKCGSGKCRSSLNAWKAEPRLYREAALSYFMKNVLRRLTE